MRRIEGISDGANNLLRSYLDGPKVWDAQSLQPVVAELLNLRLISAVQDHPGLLRATLPALYLTAPDESALGQIRQTVPEASRREVVQVFHLAALRIIFGLYDTDEDGYPTLESTRKFYSTVPIDREQFELLTALTVAHFVASCQPDSATNLHPFTSLQQLRGSMLNQAMWLIYQLCDGLRPMLTSEQVEAYYRIIHLEAERYGVWPLDVDIVKLP